MVLGSTPPSAWRITWACCSAILLSVPDEKFHSPDQDVPGLPTLCAVATIGRVTEKSATRNMNRDVVRITAPAARLRRQLSHIRHPHLPSRRRHRTTLRLQRQRQHRRQPRFLAECLALGVDWEGDVGGGWLGGGRLFGLGNTALLLVFGWMTCWCCCGAHTHSLTHW